MALFNILKKKKEISGAKKHKDENTLDVRSDSENSAESKKKERSLKPGALRMDQSAQGGEQLSSVILRPRITEKASFITEDGAYTFDVLPRANKIQIKMAIKEIFNVTPVRVNIVNIPSKKIRVRNKLGTKPGGKKAIVFLKEGERIEFV